MIKSLRFFLFLAVLFVPMTLMAQTPVVTIDTLNTYETTPDSEDAIEDHPMAGVTVQFTAVVVSYPKNSGLATFTEDGENPQGGTISRIHIFVVDTTALSEGRDGMYMQIVESGGSSPGEDDYAYSLEDLQVGDIITVVGDLGFFGGTAQFDVTEWDVANNSNVIGNAFDDDEFAKFIPLTEPWTGITVDELNVDNGDGTSFINYANYSKYASAYVEIEGAQVVARELNETGRPNWVLGQNSSSMYIYDVSLRYRNDKGAYRSTYNFRRAEEGAYEPPTVGSSVRISGFITVDDFDGAINRITDGEVGFKINPLDDGVVWLNGIRFEDGVDGFEWPNDVTVLGIAPTLVNFEQTPTEGFTTSTEVTVSIDATGATQPDMSVSTVDSVVVIYDAPTGAGRVSLTPTGDTYSGSLPTFPDFTPVSYYVEAYDNNGLVGRYPDFGNEGFFVSDGAITSFEVIQTPAGGGAGPSNLNGGTYAMDIDAVVVSDAAEDGMIIVHDQAAAWGGIFLEPTTGTLALSKGDSINITSALIEENGDGLTYLSNVVMTTLSTGNDIEASIPILAVADIDAAKDGDIVEAYEGMVVKIEDITFFGYAGFGEVFFTDAANDTMIINDDFPTFGSDGGVLGETDIPSDFDDHARLGAELDAVYGFIFTSFGAAKLQPRSLSDLMGDNFTEPVLEFDLVSPMDSAEVEVTSDINITWEETEDYDGNDLTYEWVLYSQDTSTVVATVPSNNEGEDAEVTLAFATVDGLLAGAGLEVGQSAQFVWNVRVSDGLDTLGVAEDNFVNGDEIKVYEELFYTITLTRGLMINNEAISGTPQSFSLEQNYPNPFNPSTTINFSLPSASEVTLYVYDMLGRRVATLLDNEMMNASTHSVKFDASRLASGVYIYRLEAGEFTSTRRMMLIK